MVPEGELGQILCHGCLLHVGLEHIIHKLGVALLPEDVIGSLGLNDRVDPGLLVLELAHPGLVLGLAEGRLGRSVVLRHIHEALVADSCAEAVVDVLLLLRL